MDRRELLAYYVTYTQTHTRVLAPGATKKNGEMFTIAQEMHAGSIIHAYTDRDENDHVHGYVFIIDWTGYTMKQMTRWSMDDMRKWTSCWQV